MTISSRHKDRHGNNGEPCRDNINDGTSARTRPFSFEEIMLRRKSKNAAREIHFGHVDADNKEDTVEKAADGLQSDRDRHDKSTRGRFGHVSEDSRRVSSREREDNTSRIRERKLARDRGKETQDVTETKSKLASIENLSHDNARGKSDKHVNHKRSDRPNEDSKYEAGERHSRNPVRRDTTTGKSARKSEKERELKESNDNDNRHVNKRSNVDQSRHDYGNESHKRHSRSFTVSEKNGEGHRAQTEKDRKKKHHDEERDKIETRDGKKLELRASKVSEFSERKEKESSRMHDEESRLKRRRSRSRERHIDRGRRSSSHSPKAHKHASFTEQDHGEESRLKRRRSRSRERHIDRGRRSSSRSPKAHKHTPFTEQEHGIFSSHSSKDKSQRLHSDVERKRTSSSASNSYKKHSGSSSGLGGYSPRKRKIEAAPKTSPNHSPERRTAGWDLPPVGKDGNSTGTLISGVQSSNQIISSNAQDPPVVPETSFVVKPVIVPQYPSEKHSIDSIQLTQATRPMRRLYVENLPASSSEKALMECINNFLLSSGVNHIHGTLPCISCMIHKEKGQALLEFLTPEDASAALSFDGRSFSGSILKIRRPKDFVEVTTGVLDKSVDANDTISSTVEDSIHKIFIGGISKLISPQMLIDIVRAFGPLKAFHFEHGADIAPCAFLEYIDHLVTPKACAGLNGMKLGGQVLTVVQALPDSSSVGFASDRPFYGIPEHAKPLMEKPTEILKIKNVLDSEGISLLSEAELEEILEDIRLECSRFGTVKAINVVRQCSNASRTESYASMDASGAAVNQKGNDELTDKATVHVLENLKEESNPANGMMKAVEDDADSAEKPGTSNPLISSSEPDDFNKSTISNGDSDHELLSNMITDETCELTINDRDISLEDAGTLENSRSSSREHANLPNSSKEEVIGNEEAVDASSSAAHNIPDKVNIAKGSILEEDKVRSTSSSTLNAGETKDSNVDEKVENREELTILGNLFETGCVLVEFKRAEACCMAAHCIHGRFFDDHIVTVEYVSPYLYRKRFPK